MNAIKENSKALIAFFAPVLTYIAGQLAIDEPVNVGLALSYAITALLVWVTPNAKPTRRRR